MQKILSRISELLDESNRVLVAIDGRGGAGKSSLARTITDYFNDSSLIELDWFHFPQNQIAGDNHYDNARFVTDVIEPYRTGVQELSFQCYDWGHLAGKPDGLEKEPRKIDAGHLLVVEGCMTLHENIFEHFDLRVWVDTSRGEAQRRGIRRDIEEYGLMPERVRRAWSEWGDWEDRCLRQYDRSVRADMRVSVDE